MTPLLTLAQAAAHLGVSRRTVQRATDLPRIRIGRCVRFEMEDVQQWMERHQGAVYVPSFTPIEAPRVDGVYYLMCRRQYAEAIKIGFAGNSIFKRIHELRTAHPWPLDLVAVERFATERDEKSRHRQFESCRIKSAAGTEWFNLSGDLRDHIDNLRSINS